MLGMTRRNMLFDFQHGRSTSNWEPHPRRLHRGSPRFQQRTFAECVNSTHTCTARTKLHSMITFHNANKRSSRAGRLRIAHLGVLKRVMSHSLPHMTLTTSTSSLWRTLPFFPTISPTHTRPSVHDPDLPCEVPRQSGGSTQIPSLTGYEPNAIETEAIEPEDPEPRRIELDRNLGTDPYQIQENFSRNNFPNPITEDMDEFGKVGAEMSHIQPQMHSDYESAESIADSDLECGELRKMLASPLFVQSREDCNHLECQLHRETCCNDTGERSKCKAYSS